MPAISICASNMQIRTASQKSTVKQKDPV